MVSPTAVALCHVWLHGRILVPQWFCPCGQCHHQKVFKNNHMAAPVKVARQQTTLSGTLRNLPEVASGTYTSTHRNPPQPSGTTPAHTGTLRNLPEPASRTHTSTHRNPPEPSGTCLQNLHQHTPELSRTFGTCLRNLHQPTPGPSKTFRNLPLEPTPAHTGTLRNLPEPASGTYTSTHRNPPQPSGTTPAHTGTLRNLPEPASRTHTSTHRNPPEPSGTCLQNLHQHTPELSRTFGTCLRNLHQPTPGPSKTFRNLPLEPTPAHTGTLRNLPEPASGTYTSTHGTLRNLPEPSSGTCSCDPHRHTPELIWAEDPISLRCWGKIRKYWMGKLKNNDEFIYSTGGSFAKIYIYISRMWAWG